jgi:hypothetical protein
LTNACFNAGCDNAEAKGGGVTRTMLGGEVVPYLAQSSAQEIISSATLGLDACVSAVSQQSISIMSFMPHSPALKCMGIPAKVLPASTSKRNKDASRAFMCRSTLLKNRIQRSLPRPSEKIQPDMDNHYLRRSNIHARAFYTSFHSKPDKSAQFLAPLQGISAIVHWTKASRIVRARRNSYRKT